MKSAYLPAGLALLLVFSVVFISFSLGGGSGRDGHGFSPPCIVEIPHDGAADPSPPLGSEPRYCYRACGSSSQAKKKKKWYQKIGKVLSSPIVTSFAGGILNTIVPGAGTIVQGLAQRGVKDFKELGTATAAFGAGELVSGIVGSLGDSGKAQADDDANRQVINDALGVSGAAAGEDAQLAARGAAAVVLGGAGFLVAGPVGAAAGVVAGAAVGPSVVDRARKLIKGI